MFKIIKQDIKLLFFSYKFYIGLFIGLVPFLLDAMKLLEYSHIVSEKLHIFDVFIYSTSSKFTMALSFLGLIIAFNDIPFMNNQNMYLIIRMKRKKWVYSKIIYILFGTILYYLIIILITSTFIYSDSYSVNEWSKCMYNFSENANLVPEELDIWFPFYNITRELTPYSSTFYALFLSAFYGVTLLYLFYYIGLILGRRVAFFSMIGLHCTSYLMMITKIGASFKQYLPFMNSLLGYHDILGNYNFKNSFTLTDSFIYFLVINIVIVYFINLKAKKFEFKLDALEGE